MCGIQAIAFDPAGNLLNPNRGAGAQASGGVGQRDVVPHNRLTVYQDLRFAYDLHGNVTERRIGWHTVQHYRYSPEHQIVETRVVRYRDRPAEGQGQAEPAATEQVTHYRYDALGRRIEKRDAFGRTAFLYDGDLLAGELRGSRLSEYLYEPDSFVPLAKLESEWKGEAAEKEGARPKDFAAYYYQCDQIGAPQELTDEQGRIVWAASYQVWGQTRALQVMRTGTDDAAVFTQAERALALAAKGDVQALSFVEQPLRFQGQYFDGETGLHYNRFRYYDPVTGRFVHQDPIGLAGGSNLFFFAPNTARWIDPLGLATYVIIGEGQDAVEKYAAEMRKKMPCDNFVTIAPEWKKISGKALKDASPAALFSKEWEQKAVAGNAAWVRDQVNKGSLFIDIGTDSNVNRSPFYEAEKKAISRAGGKVLRAANTTV
ncbi:RHS repeat domain-containing protein [Paracidovorax avenae]|uniref:RHS repeat domain-containing protein n=1 Tax=Paracidovorax avenae TaxID=80867 RepID=UPI001CEF69A3|nr:RHS repeat-associated core domain-containing protein [Paracidovorax avenae]